MNSDTYVTYGVDVISVIGAKAPQNNRRRSHELQNATKGRCSDRIPREVHGGRQPHGAARDLCARSARLRRTRQPSTTSPLLTDPYEFEAARGHNRNNPTRAPRAPLPYINHTRGGFVQYAQVEYTWLPVRCAGERRIPSVDRYECAPATRVLGLPPHSFRDGCQANSTRSVIPGIRAARRPEVLVAAGIRWRSDPTTRRCRMQAVVPRRPVAGIH